MNTDLKSTVIETLLAAPTQIANAQAAFDEADCAYQLQLAKTSIDGLAQPFFQGKDGAYRPAANDTERALAIDRAVSLDPDLIQLRVDREAAQIALRLAKDTFEAAKIIAGLLTA